MSESSDGAVERTARLPEGVDLHARPAGKLVKAAAGMAATVQLEAGGKTADAKSILQVMGLGARGGSDVVVRASGDGAEEAADTVAGMLSELA